MSCLGFSMLGHASAQQVAGGSPLGRLDIGLREHPAAQEHGAFLGVDRVILGRAAVDGLQGEGMAEDAGTPCVGAEVRQPDPGEETLHSTQTTRSPRYGARAWRNGSGAVFILWCSLISPS
jgi:hypothetical protein